MSRDAGPVKGGTTEIAFVKDPTGYAWEIIQRKDKEISEPIAQVGGLSQMISHPNLKPPEPMYEP